MTPVRDEKRREKQREHNAAYRATNVEKLRERKQAYNAANKDKYAAYYRANVEKILEQRQAYRAANVEKIRAYYDANEDKLRANRVARNFKVSRDEAKILDDQRRTGPCDACGVLPLPGKRSHHIDHCHDETGAVRGILCSPCNLALGMLKDDPKRILALHAYITEKRPLCLMASR